MAAAAYRSADRLHDERLGRSHDFSNKAGVVHSEVAPTARRRSGAIAKSCGMMSRPRRSARTRSWRARSSSRSRAR
ncbi:MAG: MobA/MobL family protein [Sphingopyxis sp.]|nr:MobA/MobL family protein [Sphingopyxis sp.]